MRRTLQLFIIFEPNNLLILQEHNSAKCLKNFLMEQLILKIKQPEKLPFIKEMLAAFEYIEIQEPAKNTKAVNKKHPVLKSLEQGLKEVELIKQGKLKATPLKEFLDEL